MLKTVKFRKEILIPANKQIKEKSKKLEEVTASNRKALDEIFCSIIH